MDRESLNNENQGLADSSTIGEQDLSDEGQIRFALMEFYNCANSINEKNAGDHIEILKARRNVILNMALVYLSKFNNVLVLDDFKKQLQQAKDDATEDNVLHFYNWYFNEMKVVGVFLGIRENIAEKISDQLVEAMVEEEKNKDNVVGDFIGS